MEWHLQLSFIVILKQIVGREINGFDKKSVIVFVAVCTSDTFFWIFTSWKQYEQHIQVVFHMGIHDISIDRNKIQKC